MSSSTRCRKSFLFLGLLLFASNLAGSARAIEVGEKAPDFKLPATNGADISLNDFRGKKWVLIEFYGADFAPT
jgi:peroxiredoxin